VKMPVGGGSHFPGGGAGVLAKTGFRGEKRLGRAEAAQGTSVGEGREFHLFRQIFLWKGDSRQNGRLKRREGAGQLAVLKRFEHVGGIEGEKKAHR